MLSPKWVVLLVIVCTGCTTHQKKVPPERQSLELLYQIAQRDFVAGNYYSALPKLELYLSKAEGGRKNEARLFSVIDQIGQIHLSYKKDLKSAIKVFSLYLKDRRLNDAQQDAIGEWIAAARDFEERGKSPSKIKNPDTLFTMGKHYFDQGAKVTEFPADDRGNGYFALAQNYLIPFISNHDAHPRLKDALFMMGMIRTHLRTDETYWTENYYLKEVIRRFPGTTVARRAWRELNSYVRASYTGSGGDHTPSSTKRMLLRYKNLAFKP